MATTVTRQLYTAQTRPELWKLLSDPNHPLTAEWPYFLDQDPTQKCLSECFCDFEGLRKFQSIIVERLSTGEEDVVACCRSIPFFWKELDDSKTHETSAPPSHVLQSLPDGGWDTLVARGIRQYMASYPDEASAWPWSSIPIMTQEQQKERDQDQEAGPVAPNALCGLSVTIRADRRQMGLAERMIGQMKQIAQQHDLRIVVIPLRPNLKSAYPSVPMEEYLNWTQQSVKPAVPRGVDPLRFSSSEQKQESTRVMSMDHSSQTHSMLPFDPWLRKHVRMGGKIAKVAPSSMVVEASLDEWARWTGIDFNGLNGTKMLETDRNTGLKRLYHQVFFAGGLVPLKVYIHEEKADYVEPNIWVYHCLG